MIRSRRCSQSSSSVSGSGRHRPEPCAACLGSHCRQAHETRACAWQRWGSISGVLRMRLPSGSSMIVGWLVSYSFASHASVANVSRQLGLVPRIFRSQLVVKLSLHLVWFLPIRRCLRWRIPSRCPPLPRPALRGRGLLLTLGCYRTPEGCWPDAPMTEAQLAPRETQLCSICFSKSCPAGSCIFPCPVDVPMGRYIAHPWVVTWRQTTGGSHSLACALPDVCCVSTILRTPSVFDHAEICSIRAIPKVLFARAPGHPLPDLFAFAPGFAVWGCAYSLWCWCALAGHDIPAGQVEHCSICNAPHSIPHQPCHAR